MAARASILLSPVVVTLKLSCAVFLGQYEAREAHHLRRTLHSGDCGRRRSEISIASTVHAVTLTAEAKLNHWADCLYYTLPSYMS